MQVKYPSHSFRKGENTMPFDANTKLKDIVANEQAKAILNKYLPDMLSNPGTKQAMGMSLKLMAAFPQAGPLKKLLPQILEEFAKLP
jgi:hypothetical protein